MDEMGFFCRGRKGKGGGQGDWGQKCALPSSRVLRFFVGGGKDHRPRAHDGDNTERLSSVVIVCFLVLSCRFFLVLVFGAGGQLGKYCRFRWSPFL